MRHTQMLAEAFESNLGMVKMTVADFSDDDMMRRPVPGANHAMWQLGHIVETEARMIGKVAPNVAVTLPANFDKTFGHDMTCCDDPAKFPKKDELLDLLTKVRAATVRWIMEVNLAELDAPLPDSFPDRLRKRCPTQGHLAMLIPSHATMHVGQMQVIRRALDKPVLF